MERERRLWPGSGVVARRVFAVCIAARPAVRSGADASSSDHSGDFASPRHAPSAIRNGSNARMSSIPSPVDSRTGGGKVIAPRTATDEEILRVHTAAHLQRIAATAGKASCSMRIHSRRPIVDEVARLAAGATVQAAEWALDHRRARIRARAPARTSCRIRSRDGLSASSTTSRSPPQRCSRVASSALPSSTSTFTTATGRRRFSTTIRASCTFPPTSSRSTQVPARRDEIG